MVACVARTSRLPLPPRAPQLATPASAAADTRRREGRGRPRALAPAWHDRKDDRACARRSPAAWSSRSRPPAQLTTVIEVDVTKVAALRARSKDAFLATHGTKLTFLPFFVKAATEALAYHPKLNATINDKEVTYFDSRARGHRR